MANEGKHRGVRHRDLNINEDIRGAAQTSGKNMRQNQQVQRPEGWLELAAPAVQRRLRWLSLVAKVRLQRQRTADGREIDWLQGLVPPPLSPPPFPSSSASSSSSSSVSCAYFSSSVSPLCPPPPPPSTGSQDVT